MKLLLDANISWKLSVKLNGIFSDCQHVNQIGLSIPPKDIEIWTFAAFNKFIIVTNDDDFLNFVNVKGFPPKVLLLRTGNQSTKFIEQLLIKHKDDIEALEKSKDYGIIELY
jgi:predicted nuclease of predicted toxin-antitoxin system